MIARIYLEGSPSLKNPKYAEHPVRYFDIRKLTEGECLRLMDVPEDDVVRLCTARKVLSRSSIYKLAGNSIVVACLRYIFHNIFFSDDDPQAGMSLFPEPAFRLPLPKTINMVTLCSGYDSQAIAMQQIVDEAHKRGLDTQLNLVAWSEFDPETPNVPLERQPAVVAHNLLFPQWADRNVGDMTKADWVAIKKKWMSAMRNSTCSHTARRAKAFRRRANARA